MSAERNAENVARAFDAAWNNHDISRILDHFTEDGEVRLVPPPPPPLPEVSRGKDQIRAFAETFTPGFHVESRDFRAEGDRVIWTGEAVGDRFRELGLERAEGTAELVMAGDKVRAFSFTLSPQTLARLEASMAAQEQNKTVQTS